MSSTNDSLTNPRLPFFSSHPKIRCLLAYYDSLCLSQCELEYPIGWLQSDVERMHETFKELHAQEAIENGLLLQKKWITEQKTETQKGGMTARHGGAPRFVPHMKIHWTSPVPDPQSSSTFQSGLDDRWNFKLMGGSQGWGLRLIDGPRPRGQKSNEVSFWK